MIGAVRPGCWRVDGDVDVDGECWAMVSSCRSDWSFPERIIREGCNASAADGAARNNPPPRDGATGWESGKGVGEIGRASCRERGEMWGGGVGWKKKQVRVEG